MYQNNQETHEIARMAHKCRKNPHVDDATVLGVSVWLTCAVGAGEGLFRLFQENDFHVDLATGDGVGIKMGIRHNRHSEA